MAQHKSVPRWQALFINWWTRNLGDGYESWHHGPEQGELPGFETYDDEIQANFSYYASGLGLYFMLSVNGKVVFDSVSKNPTADFERLVVEWDNYKAANKL
jgi:hypothetical protein